MTGRMRKAESQARQEQEEVVFALVTALTRLEMVELRVRQAVRRFGCVALLGPALEHLEKAMVEIAEVKEAQQ